MYYGWSGKKINSKPWFWGQNVDLDTRSFGVVWGAVSPRSGDDIQTTSQRLACVFMTEVVQIFPEYPTAFSPFGIFSSYRRSLWMFCTKRCSAINVFSQFETSMFSVMMKRSISVQMSEWLFHILVICYVLDHWVSVSGRVDFSLSFIHLKTWFRLLSFHFILVLSLCCWFSSAVHVTSTRGLDHHRKLLGRTAGLCLGRAVV